MSRRLIAGRGVRQRGLGTITRSGVKQVMYLSSGTSGNGITAFGWHIPGRQHQQLANGRPKRMPAHT